MPVQNPRHRWHLSLRVLVAGAAGAGFIMFLTYLIILLGKVF